MKKTKIWCTLGPASNTVEVLEKMMGAGMDVARLNFSHATQEEHLKRIQAVRQAAQNRDQEIAVCLDTKGPEVRLGLMENGAVEFKTGDITKIVLEEVV